MNKNQTLGIIQAVETLRDNSLIELRFNINFALQQVATSPDFYPDDDDATAAINALAIVSDFLADIQALFPFYDVLHARGIKPDVLSNILAPYLEQQNIALTKANDKQEEQIKQELTAVGNFIAHIDLKNHAS